MSASFDDDPRPIRVMVFPSRPDVLLIYVPEGEEVWLPRMRSPFQRHDVAMKLGSVDIPARVSESVPGRFTHAVEQALKAERAERGQRQREEEAARSSLVLADPDAPSRDKERARLIDEKCQVDDRIKQLKAEIQKAKANAATRGEYLLPTRFRQLQDRLTTSQARSLAIQRRLGEIKSETREVNVLRSADRNQRFVDLVKKVLPKEKYQELWAKIDTEEPSEECIEEHAR